MAHGAQEGTLCATKRRQGGAAAVSLVVMKSLRELGNAQARGDVQPLVARALEEVVIVDAQPDQLPGRQRALRAARRGWKRCRTAMDTLSHAEGKKGNIEEVRQSN
jgi:hypothetical protein